jgi:hypothetical protein
VNRIGISGHQGLKRRTAVAVRDAIRDQLRARGSSRGVTALAEGADQIFAEVLLALGGSLTAVIPSETYELSFAGEAERANYRRLRQRCDSVIELPFARPGEEAYWAAGQKVVELSDEILAVWDGQPSGGLGGTADVVDFARRRGVPVTVLWPSGSSAAEARGRGDRA